jgi:hypothetical protein
MRTSRILQIVAQVAAATSLFVSAFSGQISVVDIIPNSWSDEVHEDNEANIAVNPVNPLQVACSAFTLDSPRGNKMLGPYAPIFVSNDGGATWLINKIVPSYAGRRLSTGDITLRFGGASGVLYAGILRVDDSFSFPLNLLRTDNFIGPQPMTILLTRDGEDQPYVEAATVVSGGNSGKDQVYVGHNQTAFSASATIDFSLDAATAAPPGGFSSTSIELRGTGSAGQDGPQIRPAIHSKGIVYGVYYGWRSKHGPVYTTDIVVVRDDHGGKSKTPFQDLVDSDGSPGKRVVSGISVPFINEHNKDFGQERLGGDLAIAVDPNDSKKIFIAYCDGTGPADYTMHIRSSSDSGATWSEDLQKWSGNLQILLKAKNPGLAISGPGTVGLLYQQITTRGANQRWVTHFVRTTDNFNHVNDAILADADANRPSADPEFGPYLGDYDHLLAVGNTFYGIFCTSNEAQFPSGVRFQRNVDSQSKHMRDLANTADIPASIDPFFFKVPESAGQ